MFFSPFFFFFTLACNRYQHPRLSASKGKVLSPVQHSGRLNRVPLIFSPYPFPISHSSYIERFFFLFFAFFSFSHSSVRLLRRYFFSKGHEKKEKEKKNKKEIVCNAFVTFFHWTHYHAFVTDQANKRDWLNFSSVLLFWSINSFTLIPCRKCVRLSAKRKIVCDILENQRC